uniref:Uncharacterized protein n=1 Tax=Knipowitschia caucasica TaxID=637954 RepID=A0AAV2JZE5_KNICA
MQTIFSRSLVGRSLRWPVIHTLPEKVKNKGFGCGCLVEWREEQIERCSLTAHNKPVSDRKTPGHQAVLN